MSRPVRRIIWEVNARCLLLGDTIPDATRHHLTAAEEVTPVQMGGILDRRHL